MSDPFPEGKSPATIANIKRYTRIIGKMRKAGISEKDIEWLCRYLQADVLHVQRLIAKSDAYEAKKHSAN
jgi:hypothetical protein